MSTRREFIKQGLAGCAASGLLAGAGTAASTAGYEDGAGADQEPLVEARYYEKIEDLKVRCVLCPRECTVADRERGYCGVRENRKGTYYTLVHSNPVADHVDRIEKKPLFHFLPGSSAYSIATVGCNMECKFCQNWEISQFTPEQRRRNAKRLPPEQIAKNAKYKRCKSIAYTYTEPVVFYEYMYDCAKAGREKGVRSVMISNGYIKEKPFCELLPFLDAVKIDLKAFTNSFYKELCSGELDPVLKILKLLKKAGTWFEIVVLIIPTKNDSPQEIKEMCSWIVDNLSEHVPIHFTRFHPVYKIKNIPATPVSTLRKAHEIAKEAGLEFPYIGNVPGDERECTFCPHCGKKIISRIGFYVKDFMLENSACQHCKRQVPGIWS